MTIDPKAASGLGQTSGPSAPIPHTQRHEPLPRAVWIAIILAPILGWCSTVCMLGASLWTLSRGSLRASCAQVLHGPQRWIAIIALAWWLTLLAGDLLTATTMAWWRDLRFLLVILPALVLTPMFLQASITHEQIGRWATWSVWITFAVIGLEYFLAIKSSAHYQYRPRALSGNALFVSVMLVPMVLLSWLRLDRSQATSWLFALLTHASGVTCLAIFLGARTSTLIAIALLPLPLLGRPFKSGSESRPPLLTMVIVMIAGVLTVAGAYVSDWHWQRWVAMLQVLTGTSPAQVGDDGISTRALHWPAAWQAFLERPWLGYGFLNEVVALRAYLPAGSAVLPTAHQQFLSFLIWSGLPGLIAGTLLVALPILLAFVSPIHSQTRYAGWALGLPMLLNGLTDTVFDDLRIVSFHLMMTVLLLAAAHTAREDRGEPKIQTACV